MYFFFFFFETMVSYEYKSKQMIGTILVYCKRFVDNFKVYGETITPAKLSRLKSPKVALSRDAFSANSV